MLYTQKIYSQKKIKSSEKILYILFSINYIWKNL